MDEIEVTVKVTVTWQQVEDQLCAAWEGGSSYWLQCHGVRPPVPEHQGKVQQRYQNALYPGGAALCRIDGEGEEIADPVVARLWSDRWRVQPRAALVFHEASDALPASPSTSCGSADVMTAAARPVPL